ncbi:MAG: xcsC [Alphaproteobacteria bacterium]|nr:xcsC [Alphaproteobacteria bacterium]
MMRRAALQLQPREKRFVIIGAAIATLLLLYLLWPSASGNSAVELVPADQRPAPTAAAAPQPIPVVQAPPPTSHAPAGLTEGLALHGVMAGGAVIGFPDGSQRYVPVGREVIPGLRLQAVQLREAILAAGMVNYRLGFAGPAMALTPTPATGTAVVATSAPQPPVQAPAAPLNAQRAELGRYLQALSPRQVNGQASGYTLRPGISLPALEQVGLQPGDTILAVDGAPMTQRHVEQLAGLRSGMSLQLDIDRGGQRLRFVVQGR